MCSKLFDMGKLFLEPAKKEKDNSQMELTVPEDPTELSFWVAQNVPMLEEHRLQILELNSPIQRLRLELKAMQQVCVNNKVSGIINVKTSYLRKRKLFPMF